MSDQKEPSEPTLHVSVLRRRSDQSFFIRLGQAMEQNHRALERLAQ